VKPALPPDLLRAALSAAAAAPAFLVLPLLAPSPALAQTGGPDAFGYSYAPTAYDFVPIASVGTALNLTDEAETNQTLPFSFPWYGDSYTQIRIGANGGIRMLGSSNGNISSGGCIPGIQSDPDLAVFWDDLDPGSAGDVYVWNDTAGGRYVVSWEGVPHYDESDTLTIDVQAQLFPSGVVEFHYQDVDFGDPDFDGGASAGIGIQDKVHGQQGNGNALSVSCNTNSIASGTALVFSICDDVDGDGYTDSACGGTDCDDADASVYPGAVELCNAADDDCDPSTPDGVPEICNGLDDDCDGVPGGDEIDGDGDGSLACADCDDANSAVHPGAEELCDGIDDNCDGQTGLSFTTPAWDGSTSGDERLRGDIFLADEDTLLQSFEMELDADGGDSLTFAVYASATVGGTFTLVTSAASSAGSSGYQFHPSPALNVPLSAGTYYALVVHWTEDIGYRYDQNAALPVDYGALTLSSSATYGGATLPASFSPNPQGAAYRLTVHLDSEADGDLDGSPACADCDDAEPLSFPGNTEVCDAIDNDCDGVIPPEEADADGDGSPICEPDCDDSDPSVFPGNPEICDEADQDCDGEIDEGFDQDADGVSACDGDCDDGNAAVFPGAPEICDGLDDDCNGLPDADPAGEVDFDGDAWLSCADCDDVNPAVFPGADEHCNGRDDDCDGVLPGEEADADADGFAACEGDCDDGDASVFPGAEEACDGVDGDCDGVVPDDETDADGDGAAPCGGDCDDDDPAVFPGAPELCNDADDDCDGTVEDEDADEDGDGSSPCDGDCDDGEPAFFPGAEEICDGLDGDCDGAVPEDEADGDGDGFLACDGDCDDSEPGVNPEGLEDNAEACNDTLDNDCDGDADIRESDCDGLAEAPEPVLSGSGCSCKDSLAGGGGGRSVGLLLVLGLASGWRRSRGRSTHQDP
jgi:hypothetical protein